MHSITLNNLGLMNLIGGIDYNFRHILGDSVVNQQIQKLTGQVISTNQGIFYATQIHEKTVTEITSNKIAHNQVHRIEGADGLITNVPGLALIIKFADCTPIVIYDPVNKVQASVHSGWRSTLQKISQQAIQQMVDHYQSKIDDLCVYVGPTIDQANYEVGAEVYQAFEDFPQRERCFMPSRMEGKYLLSMQEANLILLEEMGLDKSQIDVCQHSTFLDPQLHSARREGSDYGLNAIVTIIDPTEN